MSFDNIPRHGNPNGKVFGVQGDLTYSDNGFSYVKSGSQSNTLNVDWDAVIPPAPTPTITSTPTITPTRTPIVTRTPTVTPSRTPTNTPPVTQTNLAIFTPTPTPTLTPTPSITPTITPTVSGTSASTPPLPPGTSPTPTPTTSITPSITPSITATRSKYTLNISVNGGGTYDVNPNVPYYGVGESVIIRGHPNSSNDFSSATTNVGSVVVEPYILSDGIHGKVTLTVGAGDTSVTLNFISQNRQLFIVKNGNGSVTPSVGSNIYPIGTSVTLGAIPDSGWAFYNWTMSPYAFYSNANPTVTLSQNIVATATFLQLRKVYANVDGVGNYSVTYLDPFRSQYTLSGTVGEEYFGGQYVLGVCGILVFSGGGLLSEPC